MTQDASPILIGVAGSPGLNFPSTDKREKVRLVRMRVQKPMVWKQQVS
jgi:hypothetical protein